MEKMVVPGYGELDPLIGMALLVAFIAVVIFIVILIQLGKKTRIEEKSAEERADRERIPRARRIVGYGWVLERIDDNNYVLHSVSVTEDGWAVDKRAGKSWLVRGVRPNYVEYRRFLVKRVIPLWVADVSGQVLEVRIDKDSLRASAKALPPELSFSVLNSKMLQKISKVVAQDWSMLFYGMMLGLGLAVLLVLVVLPGLGVPVQIGAKPIEVKVTVPQHPLNLPPPGNYTVNATLG